MLSLVAWWCFFLLDEIQEIYPPDFSATKIKDFDFPGGLDAATAAGTFETLALAFEKHRHKNWDFVVTTPNISKVHKLVRGAAEGAYRHKNLAVIGSIFKGRYNETFHAPDNVGWAKTDQNSVIRKNSALGFPTLQKYTNWTSIRHDGEF